ncbi:MAG: hypothetical protein JWS12_790 [Candidatus Saccharibacteria bacterium]|nr:hypothetical protein [Candidatus Saccharibacteria bacterium]
MARRGADKHKTPKIPAWKQDPFWKFEDLATRVKSSLNIFSDADSPVASAPYDPEPPIHTSAAASW